MFQTVHGVNHAGQLGSVPYRARNGPRSRSRFSYNEILRDEESFKSAKVRRERDKRATRAGWWPDREDERFKRIINRDDVLAPRKSRGD